MKMPGSASVVQDQRTAFARQRGPGVLYSLFLLALVLDVGGSFGVKYAAFGGVVFYLVFTALQLRVSVPLSFFLLEGVLFGLAPLFLVLVTVAASPVEPDLA